MSFNPKISKYFDETAYAGKPVNGDTILGQCCGNIDRSRICLYLSFYNNSWHANYLATGGVVLIAACEYWAELFANDQEQCSIKATDIMNALDIEQKWLGDVFLIEQASNALQQKLETSYGRGRRAKGTREEG